MKKSRISPPLLIFMLALTLAFIFSVSSWSQNVVRNGKTFVDTTPTREHQEPQKTDYVYQKQDSTWTIYLSAKGKAFIIRYSKRTGRPYRQYLPQITKELENGQSKRSRQ